MKSQCSSPARGPTKVCMLAEQPQLTRDLASVRRASELELACFLAGLGEGLRMAPPVQGRQDTG